MDANEPMPTVIEAAAAIRTGKLSATELTEECLRRIEAGNETLNAFVYLDADRARRAAEAVDDVGRVTGERNQLGPLAGVPFGVKDLEDCAGMPTSHGSLLYKDRARSTATPTTWPGFGAPGRSRSARRRRPSSARCTTPGPRRGA